MDPYPQASGTSISMSRHDSPRQPTGGAGAPVGSGFASVAVRPPSPPLPTTTATGTATATAATAATTATERRRRPRARRWALSASRSAPGASCEAATRASRTRPSKSVIGLSQLGSERSHTARDARAQGALADAGQLGHLGVLQLLVETQHHRGAVVGRQAQAARATAGRGPRRQARRRSPSAAARRRATRVCGTCRHPEVCALTTIRRT